MGGIGGIGGMTLAMMTRAPPGHTGRALRASAGTQAVCLLVALALAARVGMAFLPARTDPLMRAAAVARCAAFAGLLVIYRPTPARGNPAGGPRG